MSFSDEPQNDSLYQLLAGKGPINSREKLRQSVLDQTLGVIRRRRIRKRFTIASILLGCYLAGIATMWSWQSGAAFSSRQQTPEIASNNKSQKQNMLPQNELIDQAEIKSTPAPKNRYEFLCRTGDKYLREPEKLQLAIRAYSNALNHASDKERAISPDHDSWLLMALKDAHSKETKNDASQF